MTKVLVTGGLGYIGSHTVVELQESGYETVVIDNLSNSSEEVLHNITKITGKEAHFIKGDITDPDQLKQLFKAHTDIAGIIHFAASKAVGESVEKPLLYYRNNVHGLINLLEAMIAHDIPNLIFSSSCTVYGQAEELPISEETPLKKAESPYGNSKKISEEIIEDTVNATGLEAISLRYFNPIGAHASVEIGEIPLGIPQNLVPFVTQTAAGIREKLFVFGGDYPTHDGTAIRDYLHVVDLAKAHVLAFNRLLEKKQLKSFEVFNLGTGKGSSVLEVIKTFESVSGVQIKYDIVGRREGDVVAMYSDTTKAQKELGWKANLTLGAALDSAWKWEQKLRKI